MTGYEFHPEAQVDLDEIWEYIRADNLPAADRVIAEILAAVCALISCPIEATRARIFLSALALNSCTRIPDCLRARRKTLVGCCRWVVRLYFSASLISISRFKMSVRSCDRPTPLRSALSAKYSQTLFSMEVGRKLQLPSEHDDSRVRPY
jgi:ParE toxin of type II toxin-antitoxin system, parDE